MDYTTHMELVSEIGAHLAASGAETYRVEESINRILSAYGLESRVYAVPNSIIITIISPDNQPITQLCRLGKRSNNLDIVEKYSNLSRRICTEVPEPSTALAWAKEAKEKSRQYSLPIVLLGNMLVSIGFSIFFGGSLADAIGAAFCGLLLGVTDYWLNRMQSNIFFQMMAEAFIMAFAAYGLCRLSFIQNADTAVIGTLMLLVPGLLFTNAIRDIIFGDTNSGINRIVEALLIAVAVALGTAFAWNLNNALWGTLTQSEAINHSCVTTCIASFVACTGFVIIFNIHGKGKILCSLGSVVTWGAYCIVLAFDGDELLSCFVATVAAAIYSEIIARARRYPAISYLVISLLPLIPGAGIYYTAQQAVQRNISAAVEYGLNTLATAGVMAAGILIVSTTIRMWTITHPLHKLSPTRQ